MTRQLPQKPSLQQLKRRARELQQAVGVHDAEACRRVVESHPEYATPPAQLPLHAAQLVIAREHGFASWPKLKAEVETGAANGSRALTVAQITASEVRLVRGRAMPAGRIEITAIKRAPLDVPLAELNTASQLAPAVNACVDDADAPAETVLCLPAEWCYLRYVRLRTPRGRTLGAVAAEEVAAQLPWPLADSVFGSSHCRISRQSEYMLTIAAAPLRQVRLAAEALAMVGLPVVAVELAPIGVRNFWLARDADKQARLSVAVHVEAAHVTVLLAARGRLWLRVTPLPLRRPEVALTEAVQTALAVARDLGLPANVTGIIASGVGVSEAILAGLRRATGQAVALLADVAPATVMPGPFPAHGLVPVIGALRQLEPTARGMIRYRGITLPVAASATSA